MKWLKFYKSSPSSKKVYVDDKVLRDSTIEEITDNLAFIHLKEGDFLYLKNKFWLYFTDGEDTTKKLSNGEYDMLLFPHRSRYDFNSSPINDVWKKSYTKSFKRTEHILGIIEGFADDKEIYVDMVSVRKPYCRNKINKLILDALVAYLPNSKLVFENPTDDGYLFMKSTYPDSEAKWTTHTHRPESWKKIMRSKLNSELLIIAKDTFVLRI